MPGLTVCLCTRNRPDELAAAIDSVRAADPPAAAIVVSDDSTDDRTKMLVEHMDDILYLTGPRRGLGANRNNALAGVRTSHLAYLDDDARLNPRFVGVWRRALDEILAARRERIILTGGEHNRGAVVYSNATDFLGHLSRPYRPGEPLSTICINATVFPARLFDAARFDDQLVYGYDEVDIAASAVAKGYQVVAVPDLLNHHFPSPVNRALYEEHVEAARLYVTWKRYARTQRSPARAAAYCAVAPLHLVGYGMRHGGAGGARRSIRTIRQAIGHARANTRAL